MMTRTSIERGSQTALGKRFVELHKSDDLLLLPNAWDVASALLFADCGFPAIASTSAGIAYTTGLPDGEKISRERMMAEVGPIIRAVDLPVTVDLEGGYGRRPGDVARTIELAVDAGAVGANIEDSTKGDPTDKGKPLFDLSLAIERLQAARDAADSTSVPFVLNARVDGFLKLGPGPKVLEDTIRRGNAYASAGASCVFVPGVVDIETIAILTREIAAPINILAWEGIPTIAKLKAAGVKRVSLGATLFRAAYSAAAAVAREARQSGTFRFNADMIPGAEFGRLFVR